LLAALEQPLARALSPAVLQIPPLRERIGDIELLANHFLRECAASVHGPALQLSPRAMDRLRSWSWPGNAAELRQVLQMAVTLAQGALIRPKHLPVAIAEREQETAAQPIALASLAEVEKAHIAVVLRSVGGNKVMAARVLGIASSTLYEKIKRYGI
jgi:two-component system response regulator HydG